VTAPIDDSASPKKKRPLNVIAPEFRPDVKCTVRVHEVTDAMISVLRRDEDLYQRADELVHVLRHDGDDSRFSPGTPLVRGAPLSWLVDRVSAHGRCVSWSSKADGWVMCPPPVARVQAVRERGEWDGIRHLEGVIEAPSLRADGTILQTPGYDASTRTLYIPNATFPSIADDPSHSDAVIAYAHLAEIFADFPYVDPSHRAAAIAAILTLLVRPYIRGSVPCWLFDASGPRSGKSLQTDVVSLVATGRQASRMTYPEEDEELEKVLASYALAGARIVPFDNVARAFGGAALDKCITATDQVDLRVLGSSTLRTLPWRAVVLASGNNVSCRGDMLPRVLSPRLESPLENPEERADLKHPDLRGYVLRQRPLLVADAITILRAFLRAGSPAQKSVARWGGFEAWSALVPHALVWVGAPDPLGARRGGADDEDPIRAAEATIVGQWERLIHASNGLDLTVSGAIAVLYPPPRADEPPDGFNDLREALEHLTSARPGVAPSSRKVGDTLRRLKSRPVGGRKMVSTPTKDGVARWRTTLC